MTKIITTFFIKTGLTPTIRITDLFDDSLVITDDNMSEVGDGIYKYSFTSYDEGKNYAIRVDGGNTLSDAERYKFAGNESYVEDIQNVLNVDLTEIKNDIKRMLGLMHENIYMDNPNYDAAGNLVSLRIRIYSNAASIGTVNNVIGTYQVTSLGNGPGKFLYWQQVKQ